MESLSNAYALRQYTLEDWSRYIESAASPFDALVYMSNLVSEWERAGRLVYERLKAEMAAPKRMQDDLYEGLNRAATSYFTLLIEEVKQQALDRDKLTILRYQCLRIENALSVRPNKTLVDVLSAVRAMLEEQLDASGVVEVQKINWQRSKTDLAALLDELARSGYISLDRIDSIASLHFLVSDKAISEKSFNNLRAKTRNGENAPSTDMSAILREIRLRR